MPDKSSQTDYGLFRNKVDGRNKLRLALKIGRRIF
jgi:hypothetical protein